MSLPEKEKREKIDAGLVSLPRLYQGSVRVKRAASYLQILSHGTPLPSLSSLLSSQVFR